MCARSAAFVPKWLARPSSPLSTRILTRRFGAYQREFGTGYVLAHLLRSAADFLLLPVDAYLLRAEGSRGTLGPAHRRYRGHSPLENRQLWSSYDWSDGGEEWGPPEGRRALIDEHLRPRLASEPVIVEIGPGAGRWSAELLPFAKDVFQGGRFR